MGFDINSFRANFKFGGARTSKFEVQITNPVNGAADLTMPFMCKGAQLPGSTLQAIEVSYFGRAIKVPGNRTFEDWTVTVLNDEDFVVRNALEEWLNAINTPEGNIRRFGSSDQLLYKSDAVVKQMSQAGDVLRIYRMKGIFPTMIAPIEMAWENEAISEFQVGFSIDSFVVDGGVTGDAGGA